MEENKPMNNEQLKDFCLDLLEKAEICYFSTINEKGYPNGRAIFNLRNKQDFPNLVDIFNKYRENFMLYFGTNTSSDKIYQIQKNPKVCAYYCIPKEFKGVMLSGDIKIIEDIEVKKMLWQDGWDNYYRETGDYNDPDFSVMQLYPNRLNCWYRGNYKIELPGKE